MGPVVLDTRRVNGVTVVTVYRDRVLGPWAWVRTLLAWAIRKCTRRAVLFSYCLAPGSSLDYTLHIDDPVVVGADRSGTLKRIHVGST